MEIVEQEQKVAQKANKKKADNSNGISNPRYFENARTPKKAKQSLALQTLDDITWQF
jgi:hypothetical protein